MVLLSFWLAAALHLTRAVFVVASYASPLIVDLDYARYQGVRNAKGNIDFLGVRYAAPPTGKNRFREPQAPAKVNGIQIADTQPNICVQGTLGLSPASPFQGNGTLNATIIPGQSSVPAGAVVPPVSEDCLFLNVVVPGHKLSANSRLPVIAWIHGGAYTVGSASYPGPFTANGSIFDGNDLVQRSGGKAIIVLLQYRLGLHGFLSSADVKKNGALNAGLLDQQFALTWIQRHIHKFGGDPQKVAVWGESAGAGSVLQHLIANGGHTAPSLFSTAILGSIALVPQYEYNARVPEAVYGEVVRLAGCGSSMDKFKCLQAVDSSLLADINFAVSSSMFAMTLAFAPVVDGTFVREHPWRALQRGKLNAENILATTNTWEGVSFVVPELAQAIGTEGFLNGLFPDFSGDNATTAISLYDELETPFEQVTQMLTEAAFLCPTYALLRSLKGRGYKGHFAIPPALHGDDLPYYFPSLSPVGVPYNNSAFINTFSGSLVDFAINQTPNVKRPGSLLPQWPKWSENNQKEVVFNRTDETPAIAISATSSVIYERCKFWEAVGILTSQ